MLTCPEEDALLAAPFKMETEQEGVCAAACAAAAEVEYGKVIFEHDATAA